MAEKVVGAVLVDSQPTDLLFISRENALREMALSSISIDHIALTADEEGVKTYTLYRSTDDSDVFGTFDVPDGVDGTGGSLPNYQSGATYEQFEMVRDDDGFVYRQTQVTASAGNKPQIDGVIHATWEQINLGGLTVVHNPANDYTVGDVVLRNNGLFTPVNNITASQAAQVPFVEGYGEDEWYNLAEGLLPYHDQSETVTINDVRRFQTGLFQANSLIAGATLAVPFVEGLGVDEWRAVGTSLPRGLFVSTAQAIQDSRDYYINTTAGPLVFTVAATINDFTLTDFQETWTDTNYVELNFGTDQVRFSSSQKSQTFKVVRFGTTFRVHDGTGKLLATGSI